MNYTEEVLAREMYMQSLLICQPQCRADVDGWYRVQHLVAYENSDEMSSWYVASQTNPVR